jgi:two-component system, LuxR family, response regulator FixJ
MMSGPAMIHVVEDDEVERASLAALLSTGGYETRTYPSADALLASDVLGTCSEPLDDRGSCPSAIIADVQMPGISGLMLLQRLRSMSDPGGRLPVVLVTAHANVQDAVQAMKAGAVDFLEKPLDDVSLFAAVEMALDRFGNSTAKASARTAARRRLQTLLPRERDVLRQLLVRGSNKAIASDLGLSPRTVEVYRARIMTKSKAASLPELVRLAIEAGVEP